MQLRWTLTLATAVIGLSATWTPVSAGLIPVEEQSASVLLQHFSDSDKISVRSSVANYTLTLTNSASMFLHWNNERVVIPGVEAPVGSQEAVDAITTASRPISGNAYSDYIKVRNEFESTVAAGGAALNYYVSTEVDYLGQQIGGSYNRAGVSPWDPAC